MVRRWPTLFIAISLSSSCRNAIKASPTTSFSVTRIGQHGRGDLLEKDRLEHGQSRIALELSR